MIESILIGAGFALAAAVQPGPLQAFLFGKVASNGWRNTLPASFAPLLSDIPIAILTLFILNKFPSHAINYLQITGGVILFYFAYSILKSKNVPDEQEKISAPRTLLQAVIVNILNPNPYLGWSLVLGPAVIKAWSSNPVWGFMLISSFYAVMILAIASTIIIFATTGLFGKKGNRYINILSVIILALLGIYQIVEGASSIIK